MFSQSIMKDRHNEYKCMSDDRFWTGFQAYSLFHFWPSDLGSFFLFPAGMNPSNDSPENAIRFY